MGKDRILEVESDFDNAADGGALGEIEVKPAALEKRRDNMTRCFMFSM